MSLFQHKSARFLAIALVLCVLTSVFYAFTALAGEEQPAVMTISDEVGVVGGDNIIVSVSMENAVGLLEDGGIDITYDKNIAKPVSASKGDLLDSVADHNFFVNFFNYE